MMGFIEKISLQYGFQDTLNSHRRKKKVICFHLCQTQNIVNEEIVAKNRNLAQK